MPSDHFVPVYHWISFLVCPQVHNWSGVQNVSHCVETNVRVADIRPKKDTDTPFCQVFQLAAERMRCGDAGHLLEHGHLALADDEGLEHRMGSH